MLHVEKNTEDATKRGGWRPSVKNDHGNYIVDHGKIMEKSWNFVFEFLWEPCNGECKYMSLTCEKQRYLNERHYLLER